MTKKRCELPTCGKLFQPKGNQRYCCPEHSKEARENKKAEAWRRYYGKIRKPKTLTLGWQKDFLEGRLGGSPNT